MAPERWVIVDDTDPKINYTGSWFQSSQDNVGSLGSPYLSTLHGTSTAGATVEFEFNGTAIWVYGTNFTADSTGTNPTYRCSIDNDTVGTFSLQVGKDKWLYCWKAQLSNTLHTLRIEVRTTSNTQPFFLDKLQYLPSPDLSLDNKTIWLDSTDPAILFDSQWTKDAYGSMMTTQKDSVAQVHFTGTSISWVGFGLDGSDRDIGTGNWKIDEGELTQFRLMGPGDPTGIYNQLYFTTPDIEPGPHTLTVTFLGDEHTTPLRLRYLYVKNGASANNTTPSPTPYDAGQGGSPAGRNVPAILGGVIGGVAFIITVGTILFCWRRRRNRQEESPLLEMEDPRRDPIPFILHGNNPSVHPTPGSVSALGETPTSVTPVPSPGEQPSKMRKQQVTVLAAGACGVNDEAGRAGQSNTLPPSTQPQGVTTDTNIVFQYRDSGDAQVVMDAPPQYMPY